MIAQRVSAGFRPHMNTQPREGRQNAFPHERQPAFAPPSPASARENEPDYRHSCSRNLAQRGRAAESDRKSGAWAPVNRIPDG